MDLEENIEKYREIQRNIGKYREIQGKKGVEKRVIIGEQGGKMASSVIAEYGKGERKVELSV